jgi:hypothetical protein
MYVQPVPEVLARRTTQPDAVISPLLVEQTGHVAIATGDASYLKLESL